MFKTIICITTILLTALFVACNRGTSDSSTTSGANVTAYKSEKHTFDVTFPNGSKGPEIKNSSDNGEKDVTYTTTNKDGTYTIRIIKTDLLSGKGSLKEQLAELGIKFPNDERVRQTASCSFS